MVKHTKSAPVTNIRIPPASPDGWASRVETWCLTCWNGRDYAGQVSEIIPAFSSLLIPTESFSTMPAVPATEADSKVSIELSRLEIVSSIRVLGCMGTYVERSQLLSVDVELVIVELSELL